MITYTEGTRHKSLSVSQSSTQIFSLAGTQLYSCFGFCQMFLFAFIKVGPTVSSLQVELQSLLTYEGFLDHPSPSLDLPPLAISATHLELNPLTFTTLFQNQDSPNLLDKES